MSRVELVGFMESLQGQWCGRSDRRKLVDAADIVKALPENRKTELVVRLRAGLPSLYCRSYVRPSGKHFKSCKDVAFFLRNKYLIDVSHPSGEGEIRQMKNVSLMFLESINEVPSSSAKVVNIEMNDLYDVEVVSLINCSPCGLIFEDMGGLERHLGTFHKKTTRRFNLPTSEGSRPCTLVKQHAIMDLNEPQPQIDEGGVQKNGHASSSSQEIAEAHEAVPVINGNGRFKTNCTWCYKEFLCEAVDAETMADAAGFMCPKCKEKLWGVLEGSLLNSCQH